jgi:hypothetical protein
LALSFEIVGFHLIAHLRRTDALHNSAMILGGIELVAKITTDAAKLFYRRMRYSAGWFLPA